MKRVSPDLRVGLRHRGRRSTSRDDAVGASGWTLDDDDEKKLLLRPPNRAREIALSREAWGEILNPAPG